MNWGWIDDELFRCGGMGDGDGDGDGVALVLLRRVEVLLCEGAGCLFQVYL